MTTSKPALVPGIFAVLALLHGSPAHAVSPTKVWVANAGNDANPCSISQPCLTFQHAHDTVAAGGELAVLNPGDYGRVDISKSISIVNDGAGEAGIAEPSSSAIFISAGAGGIVSLRGLVLDGLGSGGNGTPGGGIIISDTGAVHIQNCVIRNFQGSPAPFGIYMIASSKPGRLFVSDTIIFNNGSSAGGGIEILGSGAGIDAVLDRVQLENNANGMDVSSLPAANSVRVMLRDSTVVGNAAYGIYAAFNFSVPGTLVLVERTTIANNGAVGVQAGYAHSVVVLDRSRITNNGTGVSAINGAQVISYGNNRNNLNVGPEGTATSFFSPL